MVRVTIEYGVPSETSTTCSQICVQKAAVRGGTAIGFAAGRRHTEDTGLHRGAACGDAGNRLVVYLAR